MRTIQLAGEVFPSFNSTESIAVELYLAGCARNPKCEGCHNPLLWDFNYGEEISVENLVDRVKFKFADVDDIALLGGEPLNHPNIVYLLESIKREIGKDIWLYTSYKMDEVSEEILPFVDFIKTGRFDKNKLDTEFRFASTNQKLWAKVQSEEEGYKFELIYGFKSGDFIDRVSSHVLY